MQRQKIVGDCEKNMFRTAHSPVVDYKQVKKAIELFHSEMEREWSEEEKRIYWTQGNEKTNIPSYSTIPGLDCVLPDGSFPPCFTSGACYALRDIIYTDVLMNAVHNSVLIRKYPESFKKSLNEGFMKGENAA